MKSKPFSSPLWTHLEIIRAMRRQRKTWLEIADRLKSDHNLVTSHKTVQNFFKRVSIREQKGSPQPLGFPEEQPPISSPTSNRTVAYRRSLAQPNTEPEHIHFPDQNIIE